MNRYLPLGGALAAIVLVSLRLPAQAPADAGPPMPYEDLGACPFEGCVYRQWTANRVVAIRVERRTGARVAFRLKKGEKVTAVNGMVVTTRPGRVEFGQPQDIETADGRIRVAPGQTLYLLTYEGEGYTKAWFNGRLYRSVDTQHFYNGVCDFNPGRCTGKIVEKGQVEWWVQIRNATGRVGWTDEPEAFEGKNAIGGALQN